MNRIGQTGRAHYWRGLPLLLLVVVLSTPAVYGEERTAVLLELNGVIGPASSDFVVRGIERAEDNGSPFVMIRLNTPGGLDTSMRDIISKILAARLPVVTYVAPAGSRAASAGTYILYASHVAAMAPATNLGAATPVSLAPGGLTEPKPPAAEDEKTEGEAPAKPARAGTAMERKVINDAAAYIKGLAEMRDRNAEWAERAVREAVSLSSADALREGVIDILAKDVDDLMDQLDQRTVRVGEQDVVLSTEGLIVETVEPDWRSKLLAVITNPNVAYVLMLLGVYGLFFELANPGSIFPGVTGAICLLLALYAFQVLPVNYAGVALILLGVVLMGAELLMPSFGVLGIGGAVALLIGSLILMDTDIEMFQISLPLVFTVTVVTVLFVFTTIALLLKQRRQPVVSGREEMIGSVGVAAAAFTNTGKVRVHGELWTARTTRPVDADQAVVVRGIDGLTLQVEPGNGESTNKETQA